MKDYKHLFFDLDRTLWDFESNSIITLNEIFENRNLADYTDVGVEAFINYYKAYNEHLWDLYKKGEVKKDYLRIERFRGTLKHFGIHSEDLVEQVAQDYIEISPRKTKLFPNTIEVVSKLAEKYQLHIITNGFSEVQFIKMDNCGLSPFFKEVITSEMIGVQKPNPKVFQYALEKTGATTQDSIMIGDDQIADIEGARNIGLDQVFFNYNQENLIHHPTYTIHQMKELLDIFK